jgi:hypothetical protein
MKERTAIAILLISMVLLAPISLGVMTALGASDEEFSVVYLLVVCLGGFASALVVMHYDDSDSKHDRQSGA